MPVISKHQAFGSDGACVVTADPSSVMAGISVSPAPAGAPAADLGRSAPQPSPDSLPEPVVIEELTETSEQIDERLGPIGDPWEHDSPGSEEFLAPDAGQGTTGWAIRRLFRDFARRLDGEALACFLFAVFVAAVGVFVAAVWLGQP